MDFREKPNRRDRPSASLVKSSEASPRSILRRSLKRLCRQIEILQLGTNEGDVHALRVRCRKIDALMVHLSDQFRGKLLERKRKAIKCLRKSANRWRDCEAFQSASRRWHPLISEEHYDALQAWIERVKEAKRQRFLQFLRTRFDPSERRRLCRVPRRCCKKSHPVSENSQAMHRVLDRFYRRLRKHLRPLDENRLPSDHAWHQLRIHIKRLRYRLECHAKRMGETHWDHLVPVLIEGQSLLGELQDACQVRTMLAKYKNRLGLSPSAFRSIERFEKDRQDALRKRCALWFQQPHVQQATAK